MFTAFDYTDISGAVTAVDSGETPAAGDWSTVDLTAFGVPSTASCVSLLIVNSVTSGGQYYGLRTTGQTADLGINTLGTLGHRQRIVPASSGQIDLYRDTTNVKFYIMAYGSSDLVMFDADGGFPQLPETGGVTGTLYSVSVPAEVASGSYALILRQGVRFGDHTKESTTRLNNTDFNVRSGSVIPIDASDTVRVQFFGDRDILGYAPTSLGSEFDLRALSITGANQWLTANVGTTAYDTAFVKITGGQNAVSLRVRPVGSTFDADQDSGDGTGALYSGRFITLTNGEFEYNAEDDLEAEMDLVMLMNSDGEGGSTTTQYIRFDSADGTELRDSANALVNASAVPIQVSAGRDPRGATALTGAPTSMDIVDGEVTLDLGEADLTGIEAGDYLFVQVFEQGTTVLEDVARRFALQFEDGSGG